jgi:hypothetical protein
MTKSIVNHLNVLIPALIFNEQTGNVEGYQILDGIIFAHEVINSLKITKYLGILINLEMSKSFNKLSWKYIHQVLLAFGFSQRWIKWILSLTSSTFFLILINGSPSATFFPTQGIKQGDPLSPFLFIFMVECLWRDMNDDVSDNKIKGSCLYGEYLPISHQ